MNQKAKNSFYIIFLLFALPFSGCNSEKTTTPQPFTIENAQQLSSPFHVVVSPNGNMVAYSSGDSLYVVDVNNSDTPIGISSGLRSQSSYAKPYMAWAPNGNKLLFRAGDDKLMIADLRDHSVDQILSDSLNENIQTFSNFLAGGPSWSPDGKKIALLAQFPNQNSTGLQMYILNTDTEELEALTSENNGVFSTEWSPNGQWLAYSTGSFSGQSGAIYLLSSNDLNNKITIIEGESAVYRDLLWSADGYKLFARDRAGKPIIFQINENGTSETIPVTLHNRPYTGWLKNGDALLSSIPDGMSSRLAITNIKSGETTLITGSDSLFVAIGTVRKNKSDLVIFTAESGNMPLRIFAAEVNDDTYKLSSQRPLNPLPSILDSVKLADYEIFKWQSTSNDTLDSQLFLPDITVRKPPIIIMPYGAYRNKFPDSNYFLTQGIQALVDRGFAVVLPNTRGIASSSQSNHDYGAPQLSDTHALIEALGKAGLTDTSRVGLIGHSHGGAMVYYYITQSSSFHAAIAVNGAADWIEQAKLRRMSGLPFGMGGMPEEFPEKYEAYSPLNNAEKVQTPILAIAGRSDTQIPPFNSEKMVDTLQSLGKNASLYIFEDEGHLIEKKENRKLFWDKVFDFLDRNVKN